MSDRQGERDLTASIRELAATLERDLRDHPTPEELQDFLAGDLPADQRERIEEHLALCRDCARAAVELAEVPEIQPERRGELVTEAEIEAQWKRFQDAVRPARHPWPSGALAAVLLFAVVGAGFATWAVRLSQQPQAQQSEPRITSPVDLLPVVRERGKPSEPEQQQRVPVPEWADEASLILDLAGVERHPEYRITIETPNGRRLWSRSGVPPGDKGLIGLGVPRGFLPPGAYQVRLLSPQEKEVAVYDLLIEP